MSPRDLRSLATDRIEDARVLFDSGRVAGSMYLAGYAIECSLKARICDSLGWEELRSDGAYRSMKTHDLVFLLSFTGRESQVLSTAHLSYWSLVTKWRPEMRYEHAAATSQSDAEAMLDACSRTMQLLA
jgi:hypothetical protein